MATNNLRYINILFIAVCLSTAVAHASADSARSDVAEIYRSQIGIRELTGRNDGREVEMYLRTCGLPRGNPWCAAFVTWVFQQAGVKAVVSAWSPAWFPPDKTIYTRGAKANKTPQMADVFGIWFANKKRVAHVGFIDEWQPGNFCQTVEGNTNEAGSREGDGVYRKRRLKTQIYQVSRHVKT